MALMRFSTFNNTFNDFDTVPGFQLFQDSMSRLFAEPKGRPWVPAVDIQETENELIFKADVPDLEMKDIDLRLENGTLTLRGERRFEGKLEGKNGGSDKAGGWHRVERSYGTFERSFALPETVDAEKVKADYKNGTLTVTLKKKEIAKPRQVKIEITQ
ncbi:MAG TPA: Hsp20/alpha crystallin family protein [Bryobacteraceae bacterium]|nr:Hsp20/alpha crystallin family protein [Bryobacteraceae bacterium]